MKIERNSLAKVLCAGVGLFFFASSFSCAEEALAALDNEVMEVRNFISPDKTGVIKAGALHIGYEFIEKDGIISLEAEYGKKLSFEPGRGNFSFSKDASGQTALAFLGYLQFAFEIQNEGKYQVWYRALFPWKGNWCHNESLDEGAGILNVDANILQSTDERIGKYIWVKGPIYELTKGKHVWKLDGWHGGTLLDKILFVAKEDFIPEGFGPEQTARHLSKVVHLSTPAFSPGAERWREITWQESGNGAVKCFISTDDGKQWQAVENNGKLSSLPGKKPLRLRFTLALSPEGYSPIVNNVKLIYQPISGYHKSLEDKDQKLAFTPFGIKELVNKSEGINYIFKHASPLFFTLKVKKTGYNTPEEISSTDAESSQQKIEGKCLKAEYVFLNGKLIVKPEVLLEKGGISRWSINIKNNSDLEIAEVKYPLLRSIKTGKDDILVLPSVWGQVIHNPVEWRQTYPRVLAMRWLDLYDNSRALYLGDHGCNFESFNDTAITVNPSEDKTSLDLALIKYIRIAPGEEKKLGDFVLGVHSGDWHWGADRYREEVINKLKKPFYPEWVRWVDGWSNGDVGFYPRYGFNLIQRTFESAKENTDFITDNRQTIGGSAWSYGGIFISPSPAWGTAEEFRQYNDEITEEGGHINFYYAWNLFAPKQTSAKRVAGIMPRSWLESDIWLPDENWYFSNAHVNYSGAYGNIGTMKSIKPMCSGAKGWQEYLMYWTKKYVQDYYATGMYYDVLCCGQAYFSGVCANLKHGHSDYGIYLRESAKCLEEITSKMREINPEFISSGEFCNDIIGQAGVLHMVSGIFHRTEIYRYTVPEQILLDGGWNAGTRDSYGGAKRYNHIFLTGCRFSDFPNRGILDLRREAKQYLYPARFMDTVGLTLMDEKEKKIENPPFKGGGIAPWDGVQAKWFLLQNEYDRVCLVNTINSEHRKGIQVILDNDKVSKIKQAWVFDLEGSFSELNFKKIKAGYSFNLPASELATVVLVEQASPRIKIEGPAVTAAGEKLAMKVRILNLEDGNARGYLTWDLPEAWKTEKIEFGPLSPGEEKIIEVPFRVGESAEKLKYDLHLIANWRGKEIKTYRALSVSAPVLVRMKEDNKEKNVLIDLTNLSSRKAEINGQLNIPSPLSSSASNIDLILQPKEKKTINIPLAGWNEAKLPLHIKLNLQVSGQGFTKLVSVSYLTCYSC